MLLKRQKWFIHELFKNDFTDILASYLIRIQEPQKDDLLIKDRDRNLFFQIFEPLYKKGRPGGFFFQNFFPGRLIFDVYSDVENDENKKCYNKFEGKFKLFIQF